MKSIKLNKTPLFYTAESIYRDENGFTRLFLDIKNDVICDYGHIHEGMEEYVQEFEALGEKILGLGLLQAKEVEGPDHFFCLSLKLLHQAINNYLGYTDFCKLLGEKSSQLVCRCFGVFRRQIFQILKENWEADAFSVLEQTKAGSGCGSCFERLEEVINQFRPDALVGVTKKRVLGQTPVALMLEVDEFIKQIHPANEVLDLKSNVLTVRCVVDKQRLKKSLEKKYAQALLVSFRV
jgi:bacterioferritin-associated ferredoxin